MLLFTQQEQEEQTGVSMGILRPIIDHAIIKPIITSIIRTVGSVSRYFQSYNGTSSFGEFATPITFTGDFSISIDIATTEAGTGTLVGGSANFKFLVRVNSGLIQVYIGDGSGWVVNMVASTTNVSDGDLHTAVVDKSGNDYTVTLNGNLIDSANTAAAVTPDIAFLGKRLSGQFYTGTPANLILVDDALSETLTFPLVSNDIEYPNENVIGDEKLTNPNFDTDTDWTKGTGWTIANGVASNDGTGLSSALYQHASLSEGIPYIYTFDITDYVSGDLKFEWDSNDFIVVNANGTYTGIFTPDSATTNRPLFRTNGTTGFTGSIDNISIKPITNAITFTDVTLIELP